MVATADRKPAPGGHSSALLKLCDELARQYGCSLVWARAELDVCAEHLERVNQPLCRATVGLWLARRSLGRCPVSNSCPKPKKGAIFCKHHTRFG